LPWSSQVEESLTSPGPGKPLADFDANTEKILVVEKSIQDQVITNKGIIGRLMEVRQEIWQKACI